MAKNYKASKEERQYKLKYYCYVSITDAANSDEDEMICLAWRQFSRKQINFELINMYGDIIK